MAFTLNDALELDIMQRFKLVAGKNGLHRPVSKVGILDHESGQTITDTFIEGEFTLASLLAVKDNVQELYPLVERLIDAGTACLAIKTVYFDAVPSNVIDLANRLNYPIFLFDVTYFEDIIMVLNNAVKERQMTDQHAIRIEHMLQNEITGFQVRNFAFELNRKFEDHHFVFYVERYEDQGNEYRLIQNITKQINKSYVLSLIPFRKGVLGIVSLSQPEDNTIEQVDTLLSDLLKDQMVKYNIGFSQFYSTIEGLKSSIEESLNAFEYACINERNSVQYTEMGIDRILLPLRQDPKVMDFYNQLIKPIMEYDREHGTDLLKTAEAYVMYKGDFKETAKSLYQHGNTIRYRIEKIKQLMKQHSKGEYTYEELAVAIRLHRIYRKVK